MKKTALLLLILIGMAGCKSGQTSFSGKKNWALKTTGNTCTIHFVYKNRLYASSGEYIEYGSPNRYLYCINSSSGKIIWTLDAGAGVSTRRPVVLNDKIYWGPENLSPWFLDPITGGRVASVNAKPVYSPAIAEDDNFSLPRGIKRQDIHSSKIIENRYLFVLKKNRTIFAYDLKSQNKVWSHKVRKILYVKYENRVNFSYTYSKGVLYIGHYDGIIEAVIMEK